MCSLTRLSLRMTPLRAELAESAKGGAGALVSAPKTNLLADTVVLAHDTVLPVELAKSAKGGAGALVSAPWTRVSRVVGRGDGGRGGARGVGENVFRPYRTP